MFNVMKNSKELSSSSCNVRRNSCCFKNLASCFRSNSIDTDCQKESIESDSKKNDARKDSFSNCGNVLNDCDSLHEKIQHKNPNASETSLKTEIGKV